MPFDLRLAKPVASGDPLEQGPLDGVLVPSLFEDSRATLLPGTEKLVQQVYLEIVNDPLPDGSGSGLATSLMNAPPDENLMASLAAVGVNKVKANILSYQQDRDANLADSEMMSDLRLLSFSLTGTSFDLRLELTTVNGQIVTTVASIGV